MNQNNYYPYSDNYNNYQFRNNNHLFNQPHNVNYTSNPINPMSINRSNPINPMPMNRSNPINSMPMNRSNGFMNSLNLSRSNSAINPMAFSQYSYNPIAPFAPKAFGKKALFQNSISKYITTAQKGIGTINQIIPLVNQVSPIVNNAKTMFRVAKAVNSVDNIDIDIDQEIDEALSNIKFKDEEEIIIENSEVVSKDVVESVPISNSKRLYPSHNMDEHSNKPTIF